MRDVLRNVVSRCCQPPGVQGLFSNAVTGSGCCDVVASTLKTSEDEQCRQIRTVVAWN